MMSRARTNVGMSPQIKKDYMSDPRNLLAEQLMQTGSSTAPVTTPLGGLARALTGVVGGWSAGKTKKEYSDENEGYNNAMKALLVDGKDKKPDELVNAMMNSDNQYVRNMGQDAYAQMVAENLKRKDPIKLGAGDVLFDSTTGKPIYTAPNQSAGIASQGGATGALIDRLNKEPGFRKAFTDYKLATQGLQMDEQGNIAPMNGLTTAKKEIKYGENFGSATGKSDAEAASHLKDIDSVQPQLEDAVTKLSELGKAATYTKAGQWRDSAIRQMGLEPGEGAIARAEYISYVDNQVLPLLRQTFGAAFTQKEGESLKATLGAPDLSPQEKDAVLESFIANKKATIETAKRRVGNPTSDPRVDRARAAGYSDEEIQQFLGR